MRLKDESYSEGGGGGGQVETPTLVATSSKNVLYAYPSVCSESTSYKYFLKLSIIVT